MAPAWSWPCLAREYSQRKGCHGTLSEERMLGTSVRELLGTFHQRKDARNNLRGRDAGNRLPERQQFFKSGYLFLFHSLIDCINVIILTPSISQVLLGHLLLGDFSV